MKRPGAIKIISAMVVVLALTGCGATPTRATPTKATPTKSVARELTVRDAAGAFRAMALPGEEELLVLAKDFRARATMKTVGSVCAVLAERWGTLLQQFTNEEWPHQLRRLAYDMENVLATQVAEAQQCSADVGYPNGMVSDIKIMFGPNFRAVYRQWRKALGLHPSRAVGASPTAA